MRRLIGSAGLALLLTATAASPAAADVTAFLGANTTPSNRLVKGVAVGVGMLVAFEFEFAETSEDADTEAPQLRTGTASALIQPPFAISGVQPYLVLGVGVFRETLDEVDRNGFALASGGGVKVSLAGPLRLRLDYRAFRLPRARHSPAHRIYAGLNLGF